jgi:hypothetical protein
MSTDAVSTCDSLYVSPSADELGLACAGRILWERRQGLRVLVVTLFGATLPGARPEEARRAEALFRRGVDHLSLGLTPSEDLLGPPDEKSLGAAADHLADLFHPSRARHLYAPLAVRAAADHRLCHLAARAGFRAGEGRSVFLFEERPEALVRGAVRIRLGQVGARLPPAAAEAAESAALPRYLARAGMGEAFRGTRSGWSERVRSMRAAAGVWRASRSWHPLRALGPRLQPVVYATSPDLLADVRDVMGPLGKVQALADDYARRLRHPPHAERYWLLLPPREADGRETLPFVVGA